VPDEENDRVPVAEVLRGLEVHKLDVNWTPVEAFVLVKCLDENGESCWAFRTTNRLNREELFGALQIQADVLRNKLVAEWIDES
jgi:hypothetical protein